MSAQRQALLGLFFVLITGVLGWFTLFKSDLSLFSEPIRILVHFEQAGGLRQGDPVLVAGLRWGEVEDLSLDMERPLSQRIEVLLSLDRELRLFGNHEIRIEDATVLGGKQLTIEPGQPISGEVDLVALRGHVSPNVMKALADVVDENRDSLASILSGLANMVNDVQNGDGVLWSLLYDKDLQNNLTMAVESVAATFEHAEALTRALNQGEGTMGMLFNSMELYDQLKSIADAIEIFADSAQAVVDDVRAGKGTVGMLLYDEDASADMRAVIDDLERITSGLDEGRGSLGILLNDPSIAENLDKITGNLANGRGTLGRLLNEEQVYDDVARLTANLASASDALVEGRGTIGKLLYEDDLYADLERAIRVLTGSLEEAREAAPISTFLNTVFLGF